MLPRPVMYLNYCVASSTSEYVNDCAALDWTIELPKQDPNSERIEILTSKQFQQLLDVWQSYPDRQLSHLHQFIGWTGSRPSEALKLL